MTDREAWVVICLAVAVGLLLGLLMTFTGWLEGVL